MTEYSSLRRTCVRGAFFGTRADVILGRICILVQLPALLFGEGSYYHVSCGSGGCLLHCLHFRHALAQYCPFGTNLQRDRKQSTARLIDRCSPFVRSCGRTAAVVEQHQNVPKLRMLFCISCLLACFRML